jgi:alpha-beta hydrolase superfamily lysophospholipase
MQERSGTFQNAAGQRLFEQHWLPDAAPAADVVIVHGYAEHLGRYQHVAAYLVRRGYAVHALDLRGHGRSEGDRVLVRSFNEHLDDVQLFLERVRLAAAGRPIFVLGHSMGGTITALDTIIRQPNVRGVMLSGAGMTIRLRGLERLLLEVMVLVGRILPRWRVRKLAATDVSRDPEVVARYDSDPLVYRGKMPAGTLSAMVRAIRLIDKRMEDEQYPVLIMHGTEDALTSPNGSRALYERASSADKTLKIYEGLYHEVLNEPEQLTVLGDIAAWLDERTHTAPK